MSDSGNRERRKLPSHPSSAGEARRMVSRLLSRAGRHDLVEPAQLLVSEVVTNALVHSGTPIDVSMSADDNGVLVEVGDGSKHVPRLRGYGPTASTGRGLALLEGTADAWGVVPGIRGKTVWFQLSSADGDEEPAERRERPPTEAPRPENHDASVTVELLNVPLLLHAAWQQHAEALLREYLLASIDGDPETDPFTVQAMATDALAVLAEHIPEPVVGVEPDQIMTDAVGPNVSSPRVEMRMPRASVPHFTVLDTVLETAHDMCGQRALLVPPVQPELRLLRRWVCEQVSTQSSGEDPAPWPPPDALHPPSRPELAWDPTVVSGSVDAVVAADDTDLIVAVSPGALRLLGYDADDQLLGQRLVSIIPARYRQAHLAGFTLYLLTGRGPLLSRPVTVPVLRRDGTETTVELVIDARRVAPGHSVFVATLSEHTA